MIKSKQIQRTKLVLIVDDQEINRDVLGSILEDDYELLYAENGEEALQIMWEQRERLSIVLLDLMMPVLNGFEVLETVRNDELLRQIPIIVLTAERSAELQALQMGASDFIPKPFDEQEVILARVSRVVELSEGRQLISAAEHDKLSMLYTRNFFMEYAERIFQYHPELHMDAVVINIEQFHSINALNGRSFGNRVLQVIGEEINAFLAGTEGIASRFEADRFAIYCMQQPDYRLTRKVSIRLRMGVRTWQKGVEPLTMFDHARAACNRVRGDFQNPLMFYDDDMRMKELLNQRLLNDLHSAADERQFKVFYQPKYDIQADPPRLASAEALIRWKHPELGMISPVEFIPLFEGNGLISVVDNFVWKEAAAQITAWREKYGFTLPVSVNVSRADVFDPTLVERLAELVESNGLDYGSIKLEVTETAYADDANQVLDVIRRLRERGFEIEMDDFGSGYSSLNMLSDMPVDVLKMDMKFIRNIENSETDRKLVTLILDIAKFLDVSVVAEGVETEGQLAILRSGNCDLVQGYFFSRPLPPEEFEQLIRRELAIERKKEA